MRTSYQYYIIGVIFPYLGDNVGSILFHTLPSIFHRFVINLINHMRILSVLLSHHRKESLCLFLLRIISMPIYDYIHIIFNRSLYNRIYTIKSVFGVLYIIIFYASSHRSTQYSAFPIFFQPLYRLFIIKSRPQIVPTITNATQYDRLSLLTAKLISIYLKLTV